VPDQEFIERGDQACWYIKFTNLSKLQTMAIRILIKANTLHIDQEQIQATLLIAQNDSSNIRLQLNCIFRPFTADSFSICD